jgi:hypothetical protein
MRKASQPVALERPLFPQRKRQLIELLIERRRWREMNLIGVEERETGDL